MSFSPDTQPAGTQQGWAPRGLTGPSYKLGADVPSDCSIAIHTDHRDLHQTWIYSAPFNSGWHFLPGVGSLESFLACFAHLQVLTKLAADTVEITNAFSGRLFGGVGSRINFISLAQCVRVELIQGVGSLQDSLAYKEQETTVQSPLVQRFLEGANLTNRFQLRVGSSTDRFSLARFHCDKFFQSGVGSRNFFSLAYCFFIVILETLHKGTSHWGLGSLFNLLTGPLDTCAQFKQARHIDPEQLWTAFHKVQNEGTDQSQGQISFTEVPNKDQFQFFLHFTTGVGSHKFLLALSTKIVTVDIDCVLHESKSETEAWTESKGVGSPTPLTGPTVIRHTVLHFLDAGNRILLPILDLLFAHCILLSIFLTALGFDLHLRPFLQIHTTSLQRIVYLAIEHTTTVQRKLVLYGTRLLWVTLVDFLLFLTNTSKTIFSTLIQNFCTFAVAVGCFSLLTLNGGQHFLARFLDFFHQWIEIDQTGHQQHRTQRTHGVEQPGPKSRHRPQWISRFSWPRFVWIPLLFITLCREPVRSEGCALVMEGAEVSQQWLAQFLQQSDTKQHDARPETCWKANNWHPATKPVVKRSIKRAYARAVKHGVAWYRGRCLTPDAFPSFLQQSAPLTDSPQQDGPTIQLQHCNQYHQDAKRFRVLQWNAGGLALHRLDSIKTWMLENHIDVAVIAETRWTYENEWSDGNFHYVHTGDPKQKGAGLLCILSARLCKADKLRWRVVAPGRLLHVQIQLTTRSIDIIGCYQHTFASNSQRSQDRHRWWMLLDALLQGLASRNVLVVAGDFNCSLPQAMSHGGPCMYHWRNVVTRGTTHPDEGHFMTLVRQHGLTGLNTWNPKLGPTFKQSDHSSRIDFIFTRKPAADGIAKDTQYAWDAPFCTDLHFGHAPIIAQLRKTWYAPSTVENGITPQQRRTGHMAFSAQTDTWRAFIETAASAVTQTLQAAWISDEDLIPQVHATAIECFQQFFPHIPQHRNSIDCTTTQFTMTKWQHRKTLMQFSIPHRHNIFRAWYHLTRFLALNRQSKHHAKQVRRHRFHEMMQSARDAATRHDSRTLFGLINKYTPKQPKRRMQLRNVHGHIASPVEEAALLKKFVMDTWKGPTCFPVPQMPFSGLPFTVDDLEYEMSRIDPAKAVARPCAPGAVWKALAPIIAPAIYDKLLKWWSRPTPFLPSWFRDAWMILIPKPNKPPIDPRALRPLALQEPIGKTIVGLLTKSAQKEAHHQLIALPLWAFLPGRSTQDALLRVARHCSSVRKLIHTARSTPHSRQSGQGRFKVAGGIQLFLDIERAFDMISREHLFTQLHKLQIQPQTVILLSLWHQETHYYLRCNDSDTPIQVGKGVRQGCRAAPMLWNVYMWLFLTELSLLVDPRWVVQCMNVFADDCQMGDEFRSYADLQTLLNNINQTLLLLQKFGLTINPAKCTALLALGGTLKRRVRSELTTWREGKEWLRFGSAEQPLWIQIDHQAKYLGTIITYANFELATIKHRINIARAAYARLKRWLTGKHGLNRAQRIQLFETCIYPVMTYGILSLGLTLPGLQLIEKTMYSMLRQILHNHAYITGHTHATALARHKIALPVEWLWRSVESLQRSIHRRLCTAPHDDIIHDLDWNHLNELLGLFHNSMHAGSDVLIAPDVHDVPRHRQDLYCQICGFLAHDVTVFRRHCAVAHGKRMNRCRQVQLIQHMKNGLPQCAHCMQSFTSWHTFHVHTQRGCQVLQAGPIECWSQAAPLAADHLPGTMFAPKQDASVRGHVMLTDADLLNVKSQEWGRRILTIVGSRTWHHMKKETDACQYLSQRCCLCDQFVGRTQELHRHFKLHHPEFWPNVQSKGHQLTNLHGEEPPCPFCNELFKANHQCPIWTQLAMLLIYGGGLTNEPTGMTPTMRCEICMEVFDSSDQLNEHLTGVHRLKNQSFNPARDSMDGQPVCNHCLKMYDNMESLRSHINQGRCTKYCPDLPTEVIDVQPQWIQALCEGRLADVLRDAHVRLQLTLRCQNCSSRYTRSMDLAGHLQTAHGQLWSASQRLTGLMVQLLYDQVGCLCNPSTGAHRASHVCLPIRQLCMQYMRLPGAILFPHRPNDDDVVHMISQKLDRSHRFMLERSLLAGTIAQFWTEETHLSLLRQTCVLCGVTLHPADLVLHLYEAHQSGHDFVTFFKQQLIYQFTECNAQATQCYACQQVFHDSQLPAPEMTQIAWDQALQAHFRSQCPCLLQTAVLLTKAAHGRLGHARHRGGHQPGLECFSGNWPLAGQEPSPGTQLSGTQASKKRRTGQTASQSSGPTADGKGQRGKGADAAHEAGPQIRQGHATAQDRGHIYLLLRAQGTAQQPSAPGDSHGRVGTEPTDANAKETCDAAETAPDASGLQHAHEPLDSPWGGEGRLRDPDSSAPELDLIARQDMPLSGMGPLTETVEGQPKTTFEPESTDAAVLGYGGGSDGLPPSHLLSCPAIIEPGSGTMEAHPELEGGHAMAADANPLTFSHLAADGHPAEAAWPTPKPPCPQPAAGNGPDQDAKGQGQGKGEEQECDTEAGMMEGCQPADPRELLQNLAHLTLHNPGNYCFANAATYCLLWTSLSTTPCDLQICWGEQRQMLTDFIQNHHDTHANLCDESWFQNILRCWERLNPTLDHTMLAQQDAAEYVHVWLSLISSPAFHMGWQQRYEENGEIVIFDHGHHYMPICLKFDMTLACAHKCDLTQLFTMWRQAQGMSTALLEAPVCICIQLERHVQDAQGHPVLSECKINLDSLCLVPVFTQQTLQWENVEYQITALMTHLGTDGAGHYRSALRIRPSLVNATTPAEWLLTDDWTAPVPAWQTPQWMTRRASMFWLIRTDSLHLLQYVGRETLSAEAVNTGTT